MDSKDRERERKSLVCAATRWSGHMLAEVVENHAEVMPEAAMAELMIATAALHKAGELVRASMPDIEQDELEHVTLPAFEAIGQARADKVRVIKAVRNATDLGLRESMEAVERGIPLELPAARAQELRAAIARALTPTR